jgi:uncharacterized membrane protein
MMSAPRRAYIDWARGLAVLLMIEAHTLDAWTRLTVRRTVAFRDATVLGGFAAPLFLWLAGVSVVLAASRAMDRGTSRRDAVASLVRRGIEIFLLGFLFRVQGFIVTPGGHPVSLFRVDILNIMGPAIAAAGLVWGLAESTRARAIWFSAIAIVMTMATPIVRVAAWVNALPLWVQWYVRPSGTFNEFTIFTAFPWAGFVFAGGAVGVLIAASRDARTERLLQSILFAVGVMLVALGFYAAARPSIYPSSSFWTSSPTWFAIRVGILTIALAMIYGCEQIFVGLKEMAQGRAFDVAQRLIPTVDPLAKMGRSSLFVYWIHVELVYGYASWLWRHRLPLWGTAIAFVVFSVLMYRAIGWRDDLVAKWRGRSRDAQVQPRVATA